MTKQATREYKNLLSLVVKIELASNLSDLAHNEAPEIQASFYSDVMIQ
jgi:hypothetical protein